MTDRRRRILFLCTHNSARSIMAEAIANVLSNGRLLAYSAGSQPSGTVHPLAAAVVGSLGYPVESLRSKGWDEFAAAGAPEMDLVITVCDSAAGEVCPVWPGRPATAHWGFPDPSRAEGPDEQRWLAFDRVAKQIRDRVQQLLALPLESLDRVVLEQRARAIGAGSPR